MSFFGRIGKVEKFRPGSPGASPRELFFFPIQPISVALTVKIREVFKASTAGINIANFDKDEIVIAF